MLRTALSGALAVAFAAAPAAAASKFTSLFVFGDSLVDAGNIQTVTAGAVPNSRVGYVDGRFTNGYNYVDYINRRLFGGNTVASLRGGNNFAFGGARIVTDAEDTIPDLALQITSFQASKPVPARAGGLYILNAGGNDIFALGRSAEGDPDALFPFTSREAYVQAIVDQYVGAVTRLNNLGARNILITGIPNSDVQFARDLDAVLQNRLTGLTLAEGTTLYRYSYISFFDRLQSDPASLGLPPLRTDKSCIELKAQASGCRGIFRFDSVHPTAAVQLALFRDIQRQFGIASIPEPQSWAMMIGGFALAGAAIRRRAGRVAFA
jgi:outer membrane lipase/esterase